MCKLKIEDWIRTKHTYINVLYEFCKNIIVHILKIFCVVKPDIRDVCCGITRK